MEHLSTISKHAPQASPQKGFTLIEMAISMLIMGILGIGVSMALGAAVTTQISSRTVEYEKTLANNIIDILRIDLRTAKNVNCSPTTGLGTESCNGIVLTRFEPSVNADVTIQYGLVFGTLIRIYDTGGVTATPNSLNLFVGGYNQPGNMPQLMARCTNTDMITPINCFTVVHAIDPDLGVPDSSRPVNRVTMRGLLIEDVSTAQSSIDRAFGKQKYYIDNTAFEVKQQFQFQ